MADVTISEVGTEITQPDGTELFEVEVPGSPSTGAHIALDTIAAYAGGGGLPQGPAFPGPASPMDDTWVIPGAYTNLNVATTGLTANTLYFVPFVAPFDMTITSAAFVVVTGVNPSSIWHGAVELDEDFQPTASGIVGQSSVDSASSGTKTATSLAWNLAALRRYALWWISDAAVSIRTFQTTPWLGGFVPARLGSLWGWGQLSRGGATAGAQSDPLPGPTSMVAKDTGSAGFTAGMMVRYTT